MSDTCAHCLQEGWGGWGVEVRCKGGGVILQMERLHECSFSISRKKLAAVNCRHGNFFQGWTI